jgi:hypothetical protein
LALAVADEVVDRLPVADPDPLRGIAQLIARWAAAFVLDPAAVTRTKALGSERMARKLRDALPGGEGALRAAVWELMRPMLSPALVGRRSSTSGSSRLSTPVGARTRNGASCPSGQAASG